MGIIKTNLLTKWPVQNKPPASTPEPSTQESTSLTRLLPRRPPPPVESRNPTDSDQEPSPSGKSEANSASNPLPSSPSRRHLRPTWSVSSKTPTSAPSTPRESPSCQRTCSSHAESVESAPERLA